MRGTKLVSPINDQEAVRLSLTAYESDKTRFTERLRALGLDYGLSCDMSGYSECEGVVSHYTEGKGIGLPPKVREEFTFRNPFGGKYQEGDLFNSAAALDILRGVIP